MNGPILNMEQAIAYLDRHINLEVTDGRVDAASLGSMTRLMTALGDPQLDVPVIQVTGTNGKGSTSAMIARLLADMGLTVGTYASPHVSAITERIQLNSEDIGSEDFASTISRLALVEKTLDFAPSWFELMTASAYLWFADTAVDVAVIEVGKLGRFDATSVVDPTVAVVTNVGFDHTDGGDTWRRDLAWEKAGIIKPNTILCLGETDPELEEVFVAEGPRSVLRRGDDFDCEDNVLAVGGRLIDLRSSESDFQELFLSAHGEHQGDNASIALAAAEAFLGTAISAEVAASALGDLRLPGRFEILGIAPLIIVDGAHNPAGAEAALHTLNEGFSVAGRRVLIVGMMQGRDAAWLLEILEADRADLVIACTAPSPRGMPAAEIAVAAESIDVAVEIIANPGEALDRALTVSTEDDLVFATGSLYVAGAIRDGVAARNDLS